MGFSDLQVKVFTRWFSDQIHNCSEQQITDISKDLKNGIALIDLATFLTQKQIPREYIRTPKRNVDMIHNCDLAINMFLKDGVDVTGITGKDINENNEKIILGLIWTLILHYSICKSVNSESNKENKKENYVSKVKISEKSLISWATDRISNYPNVNNHFQPYNLSMCALLDSYSPEQINYYQLNPEDSTSNTKLMEKVMDNLGIPIYLNSDDLTQNGGSVDEKSLLTQLASAKIVLDSQNKRKDVIGREKISSSSLDDELDEVNKAKEKAEAEVEHLTRELANAESNVKNQREQLDKANIEIQALKNAKDQAEEKLDSISVEFEELKQKISDVSNTKKVLSQKYSQKVWNDVLEIDHLREEIIRINKENEELKTLPAKLQEQIDKLQKDLADTVADRDEIANNLLIAQTSNKNTVNNLTTQINIMSNELSLTENMKNQLIEDVESYKKEIEQLKEIIHEYKENSNGEIDQIDQIKNLKMINSKIEKEAKQYKDAADKIIQNLINELNSLNEQNQKQKEVIQKQKDDLEVSEKNNILLSSLFRNSKLEAEKNKNKFDEAERIAKSLSASLKQLDDESKYQSEVNGTALSNALVDAQNEREAKQSAQSEVEHLSYELKKYEAQVTIMMNEKDAALHHIDELTKELESALSDSQNSKNKEKEAERIARELSNQLNDMHHQFKEKNENDEEEISKLSEEAENEKQLKEDALYQVEQLSNKISETESILGHQKNQYDFEIDQLKEQISNLNEDIDEFKKANERAALKIEQLHKDLIKAQSEAQINKDKEIEATRIAEGLSKSLKDFDSKSFHENELSAKNNEVSRLTEELSKANNEVTLYKEENKKAESNIEMLLNQFQLLFKESEEKEVIYAEKERMVNDLSQSLKDLQEESKAQREQDVLKLKEIKRQVEKEHNAKEAAQLEVIRLTKELNEMEKVVSCEKDINRELKQKANLLNNILKNYQQKMENYAKSETCK